MRVKEIFEARYAGRREGDWQEILEIVDRYPESLKEFVKDNEKILQKLFKNIKGSFRLFHEMAIDHDQDSTVEINAERIATHWWDNFPHNMEEEPIWLHATSRIGGPMFGDIISIFGDYIIQNAERITNYDDLFENT